MSAFIIRPDSASVFLTTTASVAALSGTVGLAKSVTITSAASAYKELHTTECGFSSATSMAVGTQTTFGSLDFTDGSLIFKTTATGSSAGAEQS